LGAVGNALWRVTTWTCTCSFCFWVGVPASADKVVRRKRPEAVTLRVAPPGDLVRHRELGTLETTFIRPLIPVVAAVPVCGRNLSADGCRGGAAALGFRKKVR